MKPNLKSLQPAKLTALDYLVANHDDIVAARQRGCSRQQIVDEIKKAGFELTLGSFSTLMTKAKELKSTQQGEAK